MPTAGSVSVPSRSKSTTDTHSGDPTDGRRRPGQARTNRSRPRADSVAADRGPAPTPATAAAQALDLDLERDLVAGHHLASEAHVLDPTEQREATGVLGVGEDGDRARLGQRLQLEDAGDDRVAGEVPGQPGLVAGDLPPGGDRRPGLAAVDDVHEPERRPMGQQADQISAVGGGHGSDHGTGLPRNRSSEPSWSCAVPWDPIRPGAIGHTRGSPG